jgi:hypothetical protein
MVAEAAVGAVAEEAAAGEGSTRRHKNPNEAKFNSPRATNPIPVSVNPADRLTAKLLRC